jgi:hypothetical protein
MISEERVASAIFKWVSSQVPNYVTQLSKIGDVESWGEKASSIFTIMSRYPRFIHRRRTKAHFSF